MALRMGDTHSNSVSAGGSTFLDELRMAEGIGPGLPFPGSKKPQKVRVLCCLCAVLCLFGPKAANAQQSSMGTVATHDARVTGGLEVHGEEALLLANASVTALDRPAPVTLSRGGRVLVCSTSEFHLLRSGGGGALLFGLNRGAFQLSTDSRTEDMILTPDMKLTPLTMGTLDLSLRVTPEGDTCVNNAGPKAPVLLITDAFSTSNYRVLPGQHLLFVKGDLHRVVDHERSPCGCPAMPLPQTFALAPGQTMTAAQAAAAHPFPEAESAGLASTPVSTNQAPPGTANEQISTSLSYADGTGVPSPTAASPGDSAGTQVAGGSASSPIGPAVGQAPGHGLGSAVRRFFHRLFHPGSE